MCHKYCFQWMTKQDIVETRVKDNLLPTLVKKNYSFSKKWLYGLFVTLTCTKKLKRKLPNENGFLGPNQREFDYFK